MKEYLNELSKSKFRTRLTKEEEQELALAAQQGDIQARNLLVEKNLPFAVQQAKRMVTYALGVDELVSAANLGLLKAADKFDPTFGVRFITYAVHQIKACLHEELNGRHLVYTPAARANAWTVSMDTPLFGTDDMYLSDTIAYDSRPIDEMCEVNDLVLHLREALEAYDQRSKDIMNAYFNIYDYESEPADVCKQYNLTGERVRFIKEGIVKKLREKIC